MSFLKKFAALLLAAAICLTLPLSPGLFNEPEAVRDGAYLSLATGDSESFVFAQKKTGLLPCFDLPYERAQPLAGIAEGAVFTDSLRSQLTENAKLIYDALLTNIEQTKSGTFEIDVYFPQVTTTDEAWDDYLAGTGAFYYDHPEYFWIDYEHAYCYVLQYNASNRTCMGISFCPDYDYYTNYLREPYATADDVEADILRVDAAIAEICEIMDGKVGKYEKIKAAHDWIVMNNVYNSYVYDGIIEGVSKQVWSPVSAFTSVNDPETGPVCEAYARAFKIMCDIVGVPCILVSGCVVENDPQNSGHMWNFVKLNDKWFAVDTTWDDPGQGNVSTINASARYAFFLVGSTTLTYGGPLTFAEEHYADSDPFVLAAFAYPELNDIAFSIETDLVKASSITVTAESAQIPAGGSTTLSASVLPANIDNDAVVWSISEGDAATIDSDGVITAIGSGTVTARATAADGSGIYGETQIEIISVSDSYEYTQQYISSLGEIDIEKEGAIIEARRLYDGLSEQSKLQVTNLDVLIEAETRLTELIESVAPGDINADSETNLVDLVQMRNLLVGNITTGVYGRYASDVNGDGECNLIDLVQLRILLAG